MGSRYLTRRDLLRWGALLGGGVVGAGLVGCGTTAQAPSPSVSPSPKSASPSPSVSASASPSAAAKPTAVKLAKSEAATSHLKEVESMAAAIVAEALGYFKDEGLDQVFTDFGGGGAEPIRAVLTGTGSMGYGFGLSTASSITAFMSGQPLRIVGGNMNNPGILYLVKADSPLKTINDLKGKKVGFSAQGSVSNFTTTYSLRKAGLLNDVSIVAVGGIPESWTAVKSGVIDCGWSANPTAAQLIKDGEARVVFKAADYMSDFVNTVTISTESYVKQNAPIIRAALAALQRGNETCLKEPDRAAKAWAQYTGLKEDILLQGLKALTQKEMTIKMSPAGLKIVEEGLLDMGLIKEKVDWAKLIDQSMMPKEMQLPLPT